MNVQIQTQACWWSNETVWLSFLPEAARPVVFRQTAQEVKEFKKFWKKSQEKRGFPEKMDGKSEFPEQNGQKRKKFRKKGKKVVVEILFM